MNADQAQITLESLQCHFTWSLNRSRSKLLHLRDKLLDIGSEEGNRWRGHIYNLRGFIQFKLEQHEDAVTSFKEAAEVFQRVRGEDRGPWLVVNYGNLAWLHHLLGDEEQSQVYLSKVGVLMEEHPPPAEGELHAEVCAEKAWTLMEFGNKRVKEALEYFEKAVSLQPNMVEWKSSHLMGLAQNQHHITNMRETDLSEKMRQAKNQDPENLYLAVLYLEKCAKRGKRVRDKARAIGRDNLETLSRSYQALRALLQFHKNNCSVDEAIDLAEEALRVNPDQRFLKKCAALCYSWKILAGSDPDTKPDQAMIDRAISLREEVVSLYPDSLLMKVNLAILYAKSNPHKAKAEQKFQELLRIDLEPEDQQLLYNAYAKYLNYDQRDQSASLRYHMKAAEIPAESSFRVASIRVLKKVKSKGKDPMCPEIIKFLENLPWPV